MSALIIDPGVHGTGERYVPEEFTPRFADAEYC